MTKKLTSKEEKLLEYVGDNPLISSKEIHEGLAFLMSYATVKRLLSKFLSADLLKIEGKGRGTKYQISPSYELFYPIDVVEYFKKEIDEREVKEGFNLSLIQEVLPEVNLFSESEQEYLTKLQTRYQENISTLSSTVYNKELERLAIDLSWKSSQIEGNTYSLLETERLLKEKETAQGKGKDEAIMLLNHKEALDFIISDPNYINPITVSRIEDIHSLLIKELGVERNIRQRRVGITGTNYKPLDNEYQIRESMEGMCDLINCRANIHEKSLLALVLISYIQGFVDGNKRTARIISNALLISHGYCPISFRTVDVIDYKKAMLIFYEQNNIRPFKEIFIDQFEFAVKTYF